MILSNEGLEQNILPMGRQYPGLYRGGFTIYPLPQTNIRIPFWERYRLLSGFSYHLFKGVGGKEGVTSTNPKPRRCLGTQYHPHSGPGFQAPFPFNNPPPGNPSVPPGSQVAPWISLSVGRNRKKGKLSSMARVRRESSQNGVEKILGKGKI
ncbi:hypothetical protein JTB14_012566 [Gonioctena quinquepunctata]|nr:hypothetical protein JTB14_012566 [Gonioctena quinquepunctata]